MKKKMLTGILAVSMLGLVLVGCGDKKEVTKTDESQVEITTEIRKRKERLIMQLLIRDVN